MRRIASHESLAEEGRHLIVPARAKEFRGSPRYNPLMAPALGNFALGHFKSVLYQNAPG